MTNSKQILNFIDIFAGAGGLSCGLEMAGMRCLLGIDKDKHAMNTFAINHKSATTFTGDIATLNKKKLQELIGNKKIDAVVGGPPCQGFSTVGIGDPKDSRNSLFLQFLRLVKLTAPTFIIIENVTGILAQKNEKTLNSIFKKFKNLGYNLDVQVMSAEKYGVPERRRRTIIIGTKINDAPTFPEPTHDITKRGKYIPAVTVGEALKSIKTKSGIVHNHDTDGAKLKSKLDEERLKLIPEGKGIRYKHDEKAYLPKRLRLDVDWEKIPENRFRQCKYYRLDRNNPSPTIMTHRQSYYHPTEARYLTPREAAKLQSFPNDFIFEGPMTAQWKQIGNAVPPLLGKALGKVLISMIKKSNNKSEPQSDRKNKDNKKLTKIRKSAFSYK